MFTRSIKWIIPCLVFILMLPFTKACSQVATGDFSFNSQSDVEEFLINYPNAEAIDGSLFLFDPPLNSAMIPISDLSGLQSLTSISGFLSIEIDADYYGLHNLHTIGNGLSIMPNPTSNFNTFDNLQDVWSIQLDFNGATGVYNLSDVFPSVTTLDGGFNLIDASFAQLSFDGFHALTSSSVVSVWSVEYPTILNYFNAFDQLNSCNWLQFQDCIINDYAGGLENLQTVNDYLLFDVVTNGTGYANFGQLQIGPWIDIFGGGNSVPPLNFSSLTQTDTLRVQGAFGGVHLPLLESLDFLSLEVGGNALSAISYVVAPALEAVSGTFLLGDLGIPDLSAFSSLNSLSGVVDISNCPNLSNCAITALCEKLSGDPASVFLENNAPGCNTIGEVLNACSISYVTGNVYADMNCDGLWNAGDFALANAIIHDQNNLPIGSAFYNGAYYAALPDNETTEIHAMVPQGFLAGPEYIFTTTTLDEVFANYEFPLCPNLNFHDVRVYGLSDPPVPGFYHSYSVYVKNEAVPTEDVLLTFDISGMPGASITSSNGGISGNIVTWTVNDLAFLESNQFFVQVYVDPSTPLGTVYTPTISATLLTAVADDDPADNAYSFNQIVVGSYDPNDKSVNRTAIDIAEIPADEGVWLDYTIRFQNTGTAAAFNVRVEDIISESLDLTTFESLDASHVFDLSFGDNRKVEWLFTNIMLPDSNTNEPESHGFIHFRIKTIPGLGVNDIVENGVAIYFDFNEPVITNIASTIFYECAQNAEIIGVADVCEGNDVILASSVNWDEYQWTLNGNAFGTEDQLLLEDLSAGQQTISLNVSDTYCSDDAEFVIDVTAIPAIPVITQNGNTLTASGSGIFNWTLNGETIADNDNTIEITASGTYGVSVMESMCVSEVYAGLFEFVNVAEIDSKYLLQCFPIPATDWLYIELPAEWTGQNQVQLIETTGRVLLKSISANNRISLQLDTVASGFYQIVVVNENEKMVLSQAVSVQ
jgi:uncharacterized repeat protein (TIGR01451 family)